MNWFDLSCVSAVAKSMERTSVRLKVIVLAEKHYLKCLCAHGVLILSNLSFSTHYSSYTVKK
jgi:hypothetical protein